MGDRAGPQSGVQVLPANRKRQEAAGGRRITMEADGGSDGARDVARRRGKLRCDGGRSRKEIRIWSESCSLILPWKKKNSGNVDSHRKRRATRLCELLAIPL